MPANGRWGLTRHTNLIHVTKTAKSLYYYQLVIKFLNHIETWQSGGKAPLINVGTHTNGQPHGPAVFIHGKDPAVY